VFSDQNFSPSWPKEGDAPCMKIIRMEDGDLLTCVSKFLCKYGSMILETDLVLLNSASQLAREGLAGYVDSYLAAQNRIRLGPRKECTVLPAPFILLTGSDDPTLLRSIFDFHSWVRMSGLDPEGVLNETFRIIENYLKTDPGPKSANPDTLFYKLPLNLPTATKSCVVSAGLTNLPTGVSACLTNIEKQIITSLLANVSDKKYMSTSSPSIRDTANSPKECRYLVIGDSHAASTCRALEKLGKKVVHIDAPNYRTSSIHVGKIAESLGKHNITREDILVVQVFDSGLFMAAPKEGGLIPHCKNLDGTYHMHGDLTLLAKDMQYELFKQLFKDIEKHKDNITIFLAPLPRYMEEGCCGDRDHMPNRREPDFKTKLEAGVFGVRRNVKDFAFRHGYRNTHTISTWGKVNKMTSIWKDSINLVEAGYSAIAEAVVEAVTAICTKKRGPSTPEAAPAAKKPKIDTPHPSRGHHQRGGRGQDLRGRGGGRGGPNNSGSGCYTDGYRFFPGPGMGVDAGPNPRTGGGWHRSRPRGSSAGRRGGY
jgi:hypothetical protein